MTRGSFGAVRLAASRPNKQRTHSGRAYIKIFAACNRVRWFPANGMHAQRDLHSKASSMTKKTSADRPEGVRYSTITIQLGLYNGRPSSHITHRCRKWADRLQEYFGRTCSARTALCLQSACPPAARCHLRRACAPSTSQPCQCPSKTSAYCHATVSHGSLHPHTQQRSAYA